MNTFLAEPCTIWKCKQIVQQTLRFARGMTQFSFTPNQNKHSQGTTDTTHVKFIVIGKNVIRSRYAMDCPYQFNLSNMYNCEKHKSTVSIIGNNLS